MSQIIFENDEICLTGVSLIVDFDYLQGHPATRDSPREDEEVTINSVVMTLGKHSRDITGFLTHDLERSLIDDVLIKIHRSKTLYEGS